MKNKLGMVGVIFALVFLSHTAKAQAPSSIAGDGFLAGVSSGAFPLASYGYFLFIPANSGSSYQVIGIYNVNNSSGTFTYTQTSASTATINANDSVGGALVLNASFSSASSGSYSETAVSYPSAYQNGSFGFSSIDAPSSIAGRTINCSVVNGASPYLTSGSYTITIASSGNTYTVSTGQTGTYSYSTLNRSTGMLQMNDSVTGSTTAYFGFSSATGGGFAIKNATGYQVGNFILLDTTAPTVSITSPTTGQSWGNSVFTVTGQASDNVQVSAVYYQIFGQGWNLATTGNGWVNWSGNINLTTPGTNIIQAYSVDTSGNSSPIGSQNMFYAIPALVSVQIIGSGTVLPNYDGQSLNIGQNYSMTATPSPGVNFTGWTGSLTTNSNTIQFLMASNLVLQANFVDLTKPTNTITFPTANQTVSNATFNMTGTALDNVAISNVFYSLNSNSWITATSANSWTNWSAQVTLNSLTNNVRAYAMDTSGNLSTTNSININCVLMTVLQISATGRGTISPNYSNSILQIGKSYSVAATAASGFKFANWVISTNWVGGIVSNNATLNFVMQSNLTLQVNFADTNKPTFSITNLVAGQRVSNAVFTVKGTASDNWQMSNVLCQLNGGAWSNAVTANNWTNWSADLSLVPGTNSLLAYAADSSGNYSATNTMNFQYVVTNQLQLSIIGKGTISPNYSNAWLEIGRNYSITSAPSAGFRFTNWTGSIITNAAALNFMMVSNLSFTANFVDTNKPTLTITTPTANQRMTNALANIIGTASDNWQVTGVWYQLNSNAWNTANTTNSFTNWTSTTLTLMAGTNIIKAFAQDLGGNYSLTNTLSIFSTNAFNLQLNFTNAQPLTTNGLIFSLQLSTGLNGHIQVSTNLTSWLTLTNFIGTNSTITFRDPAATNSTQRFYRAVVP